MAQERDYLGTATSIAEKALEFSPAGPLLEVNKLAYETARTATFRSKGEIPPVAQGSATPAAPSASERAFGKSTNMGVAEFTALFTAKAGARANQIGHWFHGTVGNVIDIFQGVPSKEEGGNGCKVWQEWMQSAVSESEFFNTGITFDTAHAWTPLNHEIMIATFADGQKKVLDPWRDPHHPVFDYDTYASKYTVTGIKPGSGPNIGL